MRRRHTRHSIAHTKSKIRRDKRNALLEIAMAEKNPEITEKHCVTKDYVLRSTYRNIFIILLHSVHYYLHSVLFMLFISVYLRVKTKDTC